MVVPVVFTITNSIGIERIMNNIYVKLIGGLVILGGVVVLFKKKYRTQHDDDYF